MYGHVGMDFSVLDDAKVKVEEVAHSHYFKDVSQLKRIDIYRVIDLFNVTDPVFQHVAKKVLVTGGRGHKGIEKDVQDMIDSLQRWQEMRREDGSLTKSKGE